MKDEYNLKEAGKGLNVFLKRTWECSFFLKMGQSRPLFCLFLSFSCYNSNNTNWKIVDGVLGIWTGGRRMVVADKTTELWRPPWECRPYIEGSSRLPTWWDRLRCTYYSDKLGLFTVNLFEKIHVMIFCWGFIKTNYVPITAISYVILLSCHNYF